MTVFRIVKTKKATTDLSGMGAFKYGGRWNNKGSYMVYTSENSSLAFLEVLVHLDESELPPDLYIMELSFPDNAPVLNVPDKIYPSDWLKLENVQCKQLGDQWMASASFLAIRVRSAVNPSEFNYLLNPLFPGFQDMVRVKRVTPLEVDSRLVR
jgi:RES domain-containing protein